MKAKDNLKKLRDLSADELNRQTAEMREHTFRLRFQLAMGQTESLNKMRSLRKDTARVQTILREKAKGK
jgi:large subunit ribosomal protein L29